MKQKFYHIVAKNETKSIKRRKGIYPKVKSTYVNAFGLDLRNRGAVYAFTDYSDAVRWAAKYEFDLKKPTVLITYEDSKEAYQKDMNFEMQLGFASSVYKLGWIDESQFVNVEDVTPEMIKEVVTKFNKAN